MHNTDRIFGLGIRSRLKRKASSIRDMAGCVTSPSGQQQELRRRRRKCTPTQHCSREPPRTQTIATATDSSLTKNSPCMSWVRTLFSKAGREQVPACGKKTTEGGGGKEDDNVTYPRETRPQVFPKHSTVRGTV